MATLWLKGNDPKTGLPRKFMDKKAVQALVVRKDAAVAEVKRQLKAAEFSLLIMGQKVDKMSDERKILIIALVGAGLILISMGVALLA